MKEMSKWSWAESFNNGDGKSTIMKPLGTLICLCALVMIMGATFNKELVGFADKGIEVLLIGASFLGLNKYIQSKNDAKVTSDSAA